MAKYELTLHDYWRILRRRRGLIFFSEIAVVLATIIFTQIQTPIYQASSYVKLEQEASPSATIPGLENLGLGQGMVDNLSIESKYIKTREVIESTAVKLGLINDNTPKIEKERVIQSLTSKINTTANQDTYNIQIIVTSTEQKEVAIIANAIASVYVEKAVENKNKKASNLKEFVGRQLEEVKKKLETTEDALKDFREKSEATVGIGGTLSSRLFELKSQEQELLKKYTIEHPQVIKIRQQMKEVDSRLKDLPADELELSRLTREVRVNEELYYMLSKKFKESQISEADRSEVASVSSFASEPKTPIKPNKKLNIIVGAVLGLVIGFVSAFVMENVDTSIGTIEEIETYLQMSVLGMVPHLVTKEDKSSFLRRFGIRDEKIADLRAKLIFYHSSRSSLTQSYHTLATNIKFALEKTQGKTILFTSAGPSEGKTLTVCNLALTLAQSGAKVLLVEMDVRRPAISKMFGLSREPGLGDIIVGSMKWQDVARGTTDLLLTDLTLEKILSEPGIENLKIITCGHIPSNPAEIVNAVQLRQFFNSVRAEFDYILLDCSPVLLFADALVVGALVDSCILLYQMGRIPREALKRAKTQLDNIKANTIGIILNSVKTAEFGPHYSYYQYSKYYTDQEQEPVNITPTN
ncbi:MAG: GNVR domain-containing protein [Candidatus Firestonebacteria bacterium]